MRKQDWPYILAVVLGLSAAIGSGFYMLSGGSAPLLAIAIAILTLGISQAITLAFVARRSAETANGHEDASQDFAAAMHHFNDSNRNIETLRVTLDETRNDMTRDRDTVARGFSELKESYSSLLDEMQRSAHIKAQSPSVPPQSDFAALPNPNPSTFAKADQPVTEEAITASPFGDQLAVSLEPIIDLSTGRTAHYRMYLALANEQGGELASDLFLHHAERIGARPALDIFVAREADILLRRLRQRDPQLNIFMPIGTSTLASPDSIAQINADRKIAADVAAGLVFELPHAVLAGLTEQALEGLAALARHGARFALSNVSIAGLDLVAMNTLNVRFVGLDASAIDAVNGPSLALASFTQTARASRVQMVVTGVVDQRMIGKLPQVTRLVSGPCFAAPRRVKKEVAEHVTSDFHAAA